MTVFSLLALAIAVFGIFSVISYAVNQRSREIGIRTALGARPADIILMLVVGGLRPVGTGLLVGLISAFALSRFLQGLLFEVQPDDPISYGVAAVICSPGPCARSRFQRDVPPAQIQLNACVNFDTFQPPAQYRTM